MGSPDRFANAEFHTEPSVVTRALEASLSTVDSLLDALSMHIAVIDSQGVVLGVNQAWRKFGRENGIRATFNPVGSNYFEICQCAASSGAYEAADVAAQVREVAKAHRAEFTHEYPCNSPTEQRWFRLRAAPYIWNNRRVVVIAHDNITPQKMAEMQARKNELALRAVLESAVDSIISIDEHGIITSYNPAAERMFGYGPKELLGCNVSSLMPSPDRERHDGYLRRYLATGIPRIIGFGREATGQRKDGSTFPIDLSVGEVLYEGRRAFTGIVRDISERKATEHALATSLKQREALLSAASEVSIIATDMHGVITTFNRGAEQMLGYSADEMVGVASPAVVHLHSEVLARSRELTKELGYPVEGFRTFVELAERDGFEHREWTYIRRDGSQLLVNLVVTCVRDIDGQVIGYLGVAVDVTEWKQSERELKLAKIAAEAANHAKSEFLANMSHELRTPMTAILGFVDIVAENVSSNPQLIDAAATIKRNGEHLMGLLNDILDLSKIEAGRLEVQKHSCNVRALTADVIQLMRVRSDAKGLELSIEFQGAIPETIETDSTRLRQILINLIGNAIKFTENGRVQILVRLERRGTPMLEFEIRDTGIGITPEQMTKLFRPFTQVDTSLTRKFGGTGLGLTISKRLAEILGGTITVSSKAGEGSSFLLRIAAGPLATLKLTSVDGAAISVPAPQAAKPSVLASLPKISCSILLAEDGPDNQRLISFLLTKAGASVELVDNGEKALQRALEGAFDIVLMDMQMPVMDGYEATRQLRSAGYAQPIVALTAHAMAGDRQKCIEAGCTEYATKPIDRAQLIGLIARLTAAQSASDYLL
ncbi:PAS/PAC sensor hybrid histidine kinase [Pirellula staleyi DSM 6068]|uniref:Sensor protein FixL n=1 Tax=Pirellula staleyi (strain ATCC 27377 / DSM 6068 / ICPB 4128) TaxID=530564 RepID=D2QWY4_PIRSD|nr:PAS domain S-box protein [Pirellula staleyi]ADB16088.1 PAS/PAC sensor hybrid histidine kinase [Pirellula staleyi DSM 6068]